jgi:hypothetical protein
MVLRLPCRARGGRKKLHAGGQPFWKSVSLAVSALSFNQSVADAHSRRLAEHGAEYRKEQTSSI